MRVRIRGRLAEGVYHPIGAKQDGFVELEVDVVQVAVAFPMPAKILNTETGSEREMTRSEERDFQEALDEFARVRLGRALADLVEF